MRKTLALTMLFGLLLLCPSAGLASATDVTVVVVDAESGEPIEDARVHVSNAEHRLGIHATTDEDGRATLEEVPSGTVRLTFQASDYVKRVYTLTTSMIDDEFRVRLTPKPEKGDD